MRDHFAVLKVGPGLTFALREAMFALSAIEEEIIPADRRSRLREICEERMLAEPKHWRRFYEGSAEEQRLLRRYSLSDRIRYYWPDEEIDAACGTLFDNLSDHEIPLGLLAQFLPLEVDAVRAGTLAVEPVALVKAHIRAALSPYVSACFPAARA